MSQTVKNVVFDFGNVLVHWTPHKVLQKIFPDKDPAQLFTAMRTIWLELNLGQVTITAAINRYETELGLPRESLTDMMESFQTSQTRIPGTEALLKELDAAGVPLYAITDNIKEFMEYYRLHHSFLPYFRGIIVSAHVGILKPNAAIYETLLNTYDLKAEECVFIDDMQKNVEGAHAVGMHAFQFTDSASCRYQLQELGLLQPLTA
jgi:putative hydrolase of the HAD superfamily